MKEVRTDWTRDEIAALFDLPFDELVYQAATVHRAHHAVGQIQLCTLLSIKTGGCPEDCGYCSQSVKADSGVEATKLMDVQAVLQKAAQAADAGSRRFCMGAAWRNPKDRDMPAIVEIVKGVRQMGMETCMTLGMLTPKQADMLAEAGIRIEAGTREFIVPAGQSFHLKGYTIPGDFSSASYPLAAAAVTGSEVMVKGILPSRQGDSAIIDILTRMGAQVSWNRESSLS